MLPYLFSKRSQTLLNKFTENRQWASWMSCDTCSVKCGHGSKSRRRHCVKDKYDRRGGRGVVVLTVSE